MSFRVVFEPYINELGWDWPDWVIPEDATLEDIQSLAPDIMWKQPLRIFARDLEDPRVTLLCTELAEYGMSENDYSLEEIT